jgi:bifunctional DNA-binding transcriptional regulator/antitoxin component of YhaV-PrlF toxin-antitoxin module
MQTVTVNKRGRRSMPKDRCKAIGLENRGQVLIEVCQEGILLRPVVTFPIESYSDARMIGLDDQEAELRKHLHESR